MDYFVERGASDQDVQTIIRRKYGERARILSRKEIRTGGVLGLFRKRAVEVTGYCSHAPQPSTSRGSMLEERQKILESVHAARSRGVAEDARAGDSGVGAAREGGNSRTTVADGASSAGAAATGGGNPLRAASPVSLQTVTGDGIPPAGLDAVLSEIRILQAKVDSRGDGGGEPAGVVRVREVLEENDFSHGYVRRIVARLREECSIAELEDLDATLRRVSEWIAETIAVYPWQERRRHPHVFVLVGPTGVGKTTTIAKLAAMYGAVADPSYDVRILTIDSYRIGALQQIQKYGEIMGIPVHPVETASDMRKHLDLHNDADFIFVDTIGKSPNDLTKLAEVNQLVRSAGGEVHLAVSATTKSSDISDILRQFEPFNYQAVVVTKLDETSSVGGIISALHEKQKSVSFITDGQSVPQDIERAKRDTFLARLRDMPTRRHHAEAVTKE
jgi:flagellar biosynthesis protein FlhF